MCWRLCRCVCVCVCVYAHMCESVPPLRKSAACEPAGTVPCWQCGSIGVCVCACPFPSGHLSLSVEACSTAPAETLQREREKGGYPHCTQPRNKAAQAGPRGLRSRPRLTQADPQRVSRGRGDRGAGRGFLLYPQEAAALNAARSAVVQESEKKGWVHFNRSDISKSRRW